MEKVDVQISKKRFNTILEKLDQTGPILVVGDVGLDRYTHGEVTRISPEAPVPVVKVEREWVKLGLAANVSDNLRSLGVDSTLCSFVGDDDHGKQLISLVEEMGLRTWGIVQKPQHRTTMKERIVTNTQQICRVDYEAELKVTQDEENLFLSRISDFLEGHSALIIQDYSKGLFSKSLISHIIKLGKKANVPVLVDPGRFTNPYHYQEANLLKPNFTEALNMAKKIAGVEREKFELEEIASILFQELKLENLLITLGPQGIAYMSKKEEGKLKKVPTVPTEVYDVSGAGDTAISMMAALISQKEITLEEICQMANFASGVVIGKKGTSTLCQKELGSFFQHHFEI